MFTNIFSIGFVLLYIGFLTSIYLGLHKERSREISEMTAITGAAFALILGFRADGGVDIGNYKAVFRQVIQHITCPFIGS